MPILGRAEAHAFERQQALFRYRTAEGREAPDLVAAGEDAVTGDDDSHWIARQCLADAAGRAPGEPTRAASSP